MPDMTIKEFSRLCGCNPQTLRYYDHVDLLKPVEVDSWSGYRYYNEEQALLYVKIKNLQTAGFSIDEIKGLLDADNDTICAAFEEKIREQEDRLRKTKEIQQSYLGEMQKMKAKLEAIRELVSASMRGYDPTEEFGINEEEYQEIIESVNNYFDQPERTLQDIEYDMYPDGDASNEETEYLEILNNPDFEVIYELHDWEYVRDFMDKFTIADDGKEYVLLFTISREKADQTAFANTALAVLLQRNVKSHKTSRRLGCNVTVSEDGKNHFWLLRSRK